MDKDRLKKIPKMSIKELKNLIKEIKKDDNIPDILNDICDEIYDYEHDIELNELKNKNVLYLLRCFQKETDELVGYFNDDLPSKIQEELDQQSKDEEKDLIKELKKILSNTGYSFEIHENENIVFYFEGKEITLIEYDGELTYPILAIHFYSNFKISNKKIEVLKQLLYSELDLDVDKNEIESTFNIS